MHALLAAHKPHISVRNKKQEEKKPQRKKQNDKPDARLWKNKGVALILGRSFYGLLSYFCVH